MTMNMVWTSKYAWMNQSSGSIYKAAVTEILAFLLLAKFLVLIVVR